jgi:predicted DNA-binding transcriptional regulator YafY
VLPPRVRERVRAVGDAAVLDLPGRPRRGGGSDPAPPGAVVATFGEAVRAGRRLRLRYRAAGQKETEREFDPDGLVYRRGRWYATGWCHLRGGRRLLRLDRLAEAAPTGATFASPPDTDPLQEVERALAAVPWGHAYEVLLETTLEDAHRRVPAVRGTLEATPEGVLLRGAGRSLHWTACILAGLGVPLTVRAPVTLREALRRHVLALAART